MGRLIFKKALVLFFAAAAFPGCSNRKLAGDAEPEADAAADAIEEDLDMHDDPQQPDEMDVPADGDAVDYPDPEWGDCFFSTDIS